MRKRRWTVSCTLAAALAACSSDGGQSASELVFHGEQPLLPGFTFDSGYQPAGSPIQVKLELSAAGQLEADARGRAAGGMLTGTPGSGAFAVDGKILVKASLKLDLSAAKYEGPLPNAPDIELAFAGSAAFDPFLLGQKATVSASVPETKLATIPLAGALSAVPGIKGELTISASGKLASDFRGVCAAVQGGAAQYTGQTTTSGTLELSPVVEVQLPLLGSQRLDTLKISVPIPAASAAMDLGTVGLGGGPPPTGVEPCSGTASDGGALADGGAADGAEDGAQPGGDGALPADASGEGLADAASVRDAAGCTPGTPDHCPTCNAVCPGVDDAATQRVCRNGKTCDIECLGAYYDVNGSVGDGCEALDALAAHATETSALDLGKLSDCDPSKTFTGSIPSDERRHVELPANRPLGTEKWFKVLITDDACFMDAKLSLDFQALPATATYEVASKFVCKDGTTIPEISTTLKGGEQGALDQGTGCPGFPDDSGTLVVRVKQSEGFGTHSTASFSITVEP